VPLIYVGKILRFQELRVWKKAHQLALTVYDCTRQFPADEKFGLTSQLRRATVSIAANIAEGSKRTSTNDLCHFLTMSEASNEEVKCLLLLSRDLHYLPSSAYELLIRESGFIGAMLNGLIRSLKTHI
jgi:four helix bundle protein